MAKEGLPTYRIKVVSPDDSATISKRTKDGYQLKSLFSERTNSAVWYLVKELDSPVKSEVLSSEPAQIQEPVTISQTTPAAEVQLVVKKEKGLSHILGGAKAFGNAMGERANSFGSSILGHSKQISAALGVLFVVSAGAGSMDYAFHQSGKNVLPNGAAAALAQNETPVNDADKNDTSKIQWDNNAPTADQLGLTPGGAAIESTQGQVKYEKPVPSDYTMALLLDNGVFLPNANSRDDAWGQIHNSLAGRIKKELSDPKVEIPVDELTNEESNLPCGGNWDQVKLCMVNDKKLLTEDEWNAKYGSDLLITNTFDVQGNMSWNENVEMVDGPSSPDLSRISKNSMFFVVFLDKDHWVIITNNCDNVLLPRPPKGPAPTTLASITSTPTVVPSSTPTPTITLTPTPSNTAAPSSNINIAAGGSVIINELPTSTPAATATETSVPTATSTEVPTATETPVPPTATNTEVPTPTNTVQKPTPAPTNTAPVPTFTPGATSTPVPTRTPGGPTATPIQEQSKTPTPKPPTPAPTNTAPVPTFTPGATSTPVPTRTPGGAIPTALSENSHSTSPNPVVEPTAAKPSTN